MSPIPSSLLPLDSRTTTPRRLLRLSLEIAREIAYPEYDPDEGMALFDTLAEPIERIGQPTLRDLRHLSVFFHEVLEFRGNRQEYHSPENSYMNLVLERRTGLPIALSVVYMALAHRASIPVRGVSAPSHFLCRCDAFPEPVFIDPFNGAKLMTRVEAIEFLRGMMPDAAVDERALDPAQPREIVRRMLGNLKPVYLKRQQLEYVHRLLAVMRTLFPNDARTWLEDGAVMAAMGQRRDAANLATRAILESSDMAEFAMPKSQLIDHLREHMTRWN